MLLIFVKQTSKRNNMKKGFTYSRPSKDTKQVEGFNPFDVVLTVNDLKENREMIISIIKEHTDKVKEVMAYMVEMLHTSHDIEKLTVNCIYDLNLNKMVDNTEYYRALSIACMPSSMR